MSIIHVNPLNREIEMRNHLLHFLNFDYILYACMQVLSGFGKMKPILVVS